MLLIRPTNYIKIISPVISSLRANIVMQVRIKSVASKHVVTSPSCCAVGARTKEHCRNVNIIALRNCLLFFLVNKLPSNVPVMEHLLCASLF